MKTCKLSPLNTHQHNYIVHDLFNVCSNHAIFKLQLVGTNEPSQPQGIISGIKANFSLSPSYSAHKSSKIYKISSDTNVYDTKIHIIYTNVMHTIFKEFVPSVMPLLKKTKKQHT